MRKIMFVVLMAVLISYAIGETSETSRTIREIEARTERMMVNPSPAYDHYPDPTSDGCLVTADRVDK